MDNDPLTEQLHEGLARDPLMPLREAELIIDAMNQAMGVDGDSHDRARALLSSFQHLLGHDYDVQLVLQNDLERKPAPRVAERVTVGPIFDRIEPRPDAVVQAFMDRSQPVTQMIVPDAIQNPRTPRTFVVGQDIPDRKFFEDHMLNPHLRPLGWADLMVSAWAADRERMVAVSVMQRPELPVFTPEDRRLTSLMLRAAAPVLHREMFEVEDASGPAGILEAKDLSPRQRDVLAGLLRGQSEKEVAYALGVSTHTVHTHVKRLYAELDVTSRGELLALFVDRKVLELTKDG